MPVSSILTVAMSSRRPTHLPPGVLIRWLPRYRGYRVALVDGERIRGNREYPTLLINFTAGDNAYHSPGLVPRGVIIVDKWQSPLDRRATIKHEADEADLMATGMRYGKAHDKVCVKEIHYRRKGARR